MGGGESLLFVVRSILYDSLMSLMTEKLLGSITPSRETI